MDIPQIRRLKPALKKFLTLFDDCFPRKDTREHLPVYICGQLSDIPEKSVEPITLDAGVPVRTLQEFLSEHRWDDDQVRRTGSSRSSATSTPGPTRSGSSTRPAMSRRGTRPRRAAAVVRLRRQEEGAFIVTVHLAYARDGFHCLLDGELSCPSPGLRTKPAVREAGIPDDMVYRPKWKIAWSSTIAPPATACTSTG